MAVRDVQDVLAAALAVIQDRQQQPEVAMVDRGNIFRLLPGQHRQEIAGRAGRAVQARRRPIRDLSVKVTGLPATEQGGLVSSRLKNFQRMGLGRVENGEKISFGIDLTASAFKQKLRDLLPGLEDREFELCLLDGPTGTRGNALRVIPENTPRQIHPLVFGKKGALYVRLKNAQAEDQPAGGEAMQNAQAEDQPAGGEAMQIRDDSADEFEHRDVPLPLAAPGGLQGLQAEAPNVQNAQAEDQPAGGEAMQIQDDSADEFEHRDVPLPPAAPGGLQGLQAEAPNVQNAQAEDQPAGGEAMQNAQAEDQPAGGEAMQEDDINLPAIGPVRRIRRFINVDLGTPTIQGRIPVFQDESADEFEHRDVPLPPAAPGGLQGLQAEAPNVQVVTRQELRMQQDIEFAESLHRDQARDIALRQDQQRQREAAQQRNEVRARRRRDREQQMNDMAQRAAQLEDQQTEAEVDIMFRLPDSTRLSHRFPSASSIQVLYDFIGGTQRIQNAKLRSPTEELLPDSNATLQSLVHGDAGRLLVTVQIRESDSSSEDEVVESEVVEEAMNQPLDLNGFRETLDRLRQQLQGSVHIVVSRDSIVDDLIKAYSENSNMQHGTLLVEFKDEDGFDEGGLTKECLRLFWDQFLARHCTGRLQMAPKFDCRVLDTNLWWTAGKILAHGLVLCGFWPWNMSLASVCYAITGRVSDTLVMASFCDYVTEEENIKLHHLRDPLLFETVTKASRVALLQFLDAQGDIKSAQEAATVTKLLAKQHLLWKPLCPLLQLSAGLRCLPILWTGVEECVLSDLRESLVPTCDKVVEMLKANHSDNEPFVQLEYRVMHYLEAFLRKVNPTQLTAFLIFCTSLDQIHPESCIKVEFNSVDGPARVPTARTCSSTLTLSRYYANEEDLAVDFLSILNDSSSMVFRTL